MSDKNDIFINIIKNILHSYRLYFKTTQGTVQNHYSNNIINKITILKTVFYNKDEEVYFIKLLFLQITYLSYAKQLLDSCEWLFPFIYLLSLLQMSDLSLCFL